MKTILSVVCQLGFKNDLMVDYSVIVRWFIICHYIALYLSYCSKQFSHSDLVYHVIILGIEFSLIKIDVIKIGRPSS